MMSAGGNGVEVDDRVATISGLIPRSNYTISVLAFRFSLSDVPPMVYLGPPAVIIALTAVPSGNHLSPSPSSMYLSCMSAW